MPQLIDLPLFIAFLSAATLLTLTPGLDTAMVLRAALIGRSRVALCAASGVTLGCLAWGIAASLGLGVLLSTSEILYTAVKFAGAAYLVYLGLGLLLRGRKQMAGEFSQPTLNSLSAFRQGFFTNLLNPKIGVFYVSFIPHFIPVGADVPFYSFLLAVVHASISMIWFVVLIFSAAHLSRWFSNPRVISGLDKLTGGVFVGFGLKLALSKD